MYDNSIMYEAEWDLLILPGIKEAWYHSDVIAVEWDNIQP